MTHGVFRDYSEILLHLRVIYLQACVRVFRLLQWFMGRGGVYSECMGFSWTVNKTVPVSMVGGWGSQDNDYVGAFTK